MLYKIEVIVNNIYSLALPVDGISLKLVKNEFNLLTTDAASARPLSYTQSFEIPYDKNKVIFSKMIKRGNNFATVRYNGVDIISGPIFDFSANKDKDTILISIASSFKNVVDFLGDNILYLDKVNLTEENKIIENFTASSDTEILKYGLYNPMDTTTGSIIKNDDNINDYCRPSLSIFNLIKKAVRQSGWALDYSGVDPEALKAVILPSTDNFASSFGFHGSINTTLAGDLSLLTSDNLLYNINGGGELVDTGIQPRYPARNMCFKLKIKFEKYDNFLIRIMEGDNELYYSETNGVENLRYITDMIQTKNGIDPINVILSPIGDSCDIKLSFEFINLFTCNETNEDTFLSPLGFMYPTASNFPDLTTLEVLREWLLLYQIAVEVNDSTKLIRFYHIKSVVAKWIDKIDTSPDLLWDDYSIITDWGGISKINSVKFLAGERKQAHFNTKISSLPSSGNYFISKFTETSENKAWGSITLPTLKYTAKTVNNIVSEYLQYNANGYYIGTYDEDTRVIHTISIQKVYNKYWKSIINYISTAVGTPTAYKLNLRVHYSDFIKKYKQSNLFYYNNNNALMMNGEYNVINQTFTGTFVSVE